MSQDPIRTAINKLEEDLTKLNMEVKKKRQAINVLYETLGEAGPYKIEGEPEASKVLRRDQFFGKPFATAAQEFLSTKKQACSAEEITHGLEEGGFDFEWPPKNRIRLVGMSLSKNSMVFEKLPNNTFGLLEWYPERQQKRKRIAKTEQNQVTKNSNEENKEEEPK